MLTSGGTVMKTFQPRLSRLLAGCGGAGLVALLAASGCATEAGGLSASLTPEQYAQVSLEQCSGVPAKEQELGVMAFRSAVANAQPLKETYQVGKTKFERDRGVQIAVRAQPNITAPWLARVATCHIALARSGRINPNESDPLTVAGATVQVDEAYTGYVVSVHVTDDVAAAEVMRRTTVALTGPTGPATAERLAP
jgi:hypothetical protein